MDMNLLLFFMVFSLFFLFLGGGGVGRLTCQTLSQKVKVKNENSKP